MPAAVFMPQESAIALIADDGTRFVVPVADAPPIADALDRLHRILHRQGRSSVRIAGRAYLKLDVADAPALAAAIRDALAVPAHAAALIEEPTS